MAKKIEVFFVNGNRAKFDRDKVVFQSLTSEDLFGRGGIDLALVDSGKALINWGAVSFVRAAEDKEDGE